MSSFSWPVITSANPSVGGTGTTAPTSAAEMGAIDGSGNLVGLVVTANGLKVDVIATALPTGAATSAKQDTGNTSLASIDGKLGSLGQKAMAGSAPVVLASDQASIPVAATQSGTWNITNVSGTVSLPTGASTGAKQDTGNTSLSSIDGKLGSLGQKAMSGSAPVVLASDQAAIPVSQNGTWNITNVSGTVSLPTGAATGAKQDTGNTSVASIDTKTPALGQALAASSVPVVLTAAQLSTLTPLTSVAATQSGTWTVQPGNTANTTAWLVNPDSKTKANTPVFNDYSSTSVTTGAYVQLVASTTSICSAVEVYNQSGSSLYFATGAALSEVNQFIIPPGGNGMVSIAIAASTRISVKAVDVTVTAGSLIVNFWS